jgi:hypothetical protein
MSLGFEHLIPDMAGHEYGRRAKLQSVTGAEFAAVGKAVEIVGKKALSQDEKTKDQLLGAAEGTPEFESAARALAARTAVKERIKLRLYQPFARMLGVSEAYFRDKFPEEMAAKTDDIPDEHMVTPPASIAVPALQGLSYSFDESSLKDLYLNLLTTAADDRRADDAHPAFADIIRQLTSKETKILNEVLKHDRVPIARLKDVLTYKEFEIKAIHLLPWSDGDVGELAKQHQTATWVDNWARLGLVQVDYLTFIAKESVYDWVTSRPEYVRLSQDPEIARLDFDKGIIQRTAFGTQFHRAVAPPEEVSSQH